MGKPRNIIMYEMQVKDVRLAKENNPSKNSKLNIQLKIIRIFSLHVLF
jgi:hypothetical protein